MKTIVTLLTVGLLWSLWGYVTSNVEQAKYIVTQKNRTYEIRKYAPHIEAQTNVKGLYSESLSEGFRILAGYIFGRNEKRTSIAMTVPVTTKKTASKAEKIAMTAPVFAQKNAHTQTIAFVMPSSYTLKSLPKPNDPRVKLVEVPQKTMAVLRFTWFRSDSRIQHMEKKLLEALEYDKIKTIGEPFFAGYNPPWTPPWMTRNEILVEIKNPKS